MNVHSYIYRRTMIMKTSDKRDNIMQAAMDLIVEHGFHGAPMAMIAEKAGVAAGTIYRYFESKDALIMELYRELEVKLTARLLEGYSTELSIREQFIHLGTALLRYFIEHPLQFRYIEQYHDSPYGVSLRRDRLMGKNDRGDVNLFKDLLEQGIARQMLKDVPLIVIFALAFAPLMFLTRDHILGFVNMDEALIKKTTEACWDAIKRL